MMEWQHIPVSSELTRRIKRILMPLGYASVAQFVSESVRLNLQIQEAKADELRDDIRTGRKVKGKETDDLPF